MGELGGIADRYNMVVAFRTSLASFAAIHEALRRVHCPWFGVDFDPAAAVGDAWPVDEIFSRWAGRSGMCVGATRSRGADRRTAQP